MKLEKQIKTKEEEEKEKQKEENQINGKEMKSKRPTAFFFSWIFLNDARMMSTVKLRSKALFFFHSPQIRKKHVCGLSNGFFS